jgi:hypothetical protein
MWVLKGNDIEKCSLTTMDANITLLAQKNNENFGRLVWWVLWGENIIKCNMKYQYASIACSN